MFVRPYRINDITVKTNVVASAQDVAVNGKTFMIANTGAQPAYFKEKNGVAATATNSMLIPANSVFPIPITADTLSIISNATGTTVSIMFLDI